MEDLERIQTRILQRISNLEHKLSSTSDDSAANNATAERLSAILRSNGVKDFAFKVVCSDYYDLSLQSRRDLLSAPSIHHLCKSIVLVNTQAQSHVIDCSNRNNSKYYVVVVQYTARFNAEMVKNYLYSLNEGKVPKKKINLRLAPEEISNNLTGFEHNAVTCIGMKTDIPLHLETQLFIIILELILSGDENVQREAKLGEWASITMVILDEAIVKLSPDFFWLGGGEVNLKMGIRTSEFIQFVKPFIFSCSTA